MLVYAFIIDYGELLIWLILVHVMISVVLVITSCLIYCCCREVCRKTPISYLSIHLFYYLDVHLKFDFVLMTYVIYEKWCFKTYSVPTCSNHENKCMVGNFQVWIFQICFYICSESNMKQANPKSNFIIHQELTIFDPRKKQNRLCVRLRYDCKTLLTLIFCYCLG